MCIHTISKMTIDTLNKMKQWFSTVGEFFPLRLFSNFWRVSIVLIEEEVSMSSIEWRLQILLNML